MRAVKERIGDSSAVCDVKRASVGASASHNYRLSTRRPRGEGFKTLIFGRGVIPLLASGKEGWLRHQNKFREATEADAAGVVSTIF